MKSFVILLIFCIFLEEISPKKDCINNLKFLAAYANCVRNMKQLNCNNYQHDSNCVSKINTKCKEKNELVLKFNKTIQSIVSTLDTECKNKCGIMFNRCFHNFDKTIDFRENFMEQVFKFFKKSFQEWEENICPHLVKILDCTSPCLNEKRYFTLITELFIDGCRKNPKFVERLISKLQNSKFESSIKICFEGQLELTCPEYQAKYDCVSELENLHLDISDIHSISSKLIHPLVDRFAKECILFYKAPKVCTSMSVDNCDPEFRLKSTFWFKHHTDEEIVQFCQKRNNDYFSCFKKANCFIPGDKVTSLNIYFWRHYEANNYLCNNEDYIVFNNQLKDNTYVTNLEICHNLSVIGNNEEEYCNAAKEIIKCFTDISKNNINLQDVFLNHYINEIYVKYFMNLLPKCSLYDHH